MTIDHPFETSNTHANIPLTITINNPINKQHKILDEKCGGLDPGIIFVRHCVAKPPKIKFNLRNVIFVFFFNVLAMSPLCDEKNIDWCCVPLFLWWIIATRR